MTSTFWSNTIWYILLGVITIIQIIVVLEKVKNRAYIAALFFFISGMTFSIEVIIYCFLRSYDYYPMVFPNSPIDDGLAGNLFSQFSITSTGLLIIAFNLKYYWFFIFTALYGIIEELFLKLGIYSQNWYITWITMIGLPVLFTFWKKVSKSNFVFNVGIWRYLSMFFGLFTLHMITIWWPFLILDIVKINKKIFTDPLTSYTFISLLNLFISSIVCMFIYFSKSKWWIKSIAIWFLYSVIYISNNLNIIHIKPGWLLLVATIDTFGMLLYVYILDKLFTKASSVY